MMAWYDGVRPTVPSRTLKVDWSRLIDREVDPYLQWADLTGFQSIAREGAPAGVASPDDQVRIAAECTPDGALPTLPGVSWHRVLPTDKALFATAFVRAGNLKDVLVHPRVRRVELGFCAPAGQASASAPRLSPGRKPKRTTRTTLAVIDFGCAFAHERFRSRCADGSWKSRIAFLWDQGRAPAPSGDTRWRAVPGPDYGRELRAADIDRLLGEHRQGSGPGIDEDAVYRHAQYDTVQRALMHGTHVLDIAAGEDPATAIDSTAEIIFVQLPDFAIDDTSGGSMVTHVFDALGYILERTGKDAALVINLSYGAMAGPHDGSTLTEAVMDAVIEASMGAIDAQTPPGRYLSIVLPAGNSFTSDGHAEMVLSAGAPSRRLHWQVQADNPTDAFLEVWYPRHAAGRISVVVTAPGGASARTSIDHVMTLRRTPEGEPIGAVLHRRMASAGTDQACAVVALAPTRTRDGTRAIAPAGVWTVDIDLAPGAPGAETVPVDVWIERDDPPIGSGAPPRQSFLLTGQLPLAGNAGSPRGSLVRRESTCNSVATGARTIVVGACAARKNQFAGMADYSSAGPTRNPLRTAWPDLVASAEVSSTLSGIRAAGTRSGIRLRMNGTSVAAPKVARALIEKCVKAAAAASGPTPVGTVASGKTKPGYSKLPTPTPGAKPKLKLKPGRLSIQLQEDVPRAGRGFLVTKASDE